MKITLNESVNASIDTVWNAWLTPEHVVNWNFASHDWHCSKAEVDATEGGRFKYLMEEKDGGGGFDFEGEFTKVEPKRALAYTITDGRLVTVDFEDKGESVDITQTFETEEHLAEAEQRQGWQNILSNFKQYAEQL